MRHKAEGKLVGAPVWRWPSLANRARIAAKDIAQIRERHRGHKPTIAERQTELLAFYERFEQLVETICNAAQYGPNSRLASEYATYRSELADTYNRLRSYLDAFLPPDESDAFDHLLGSHDLTRFLAEDDGTMIFRITSTREALSLYAEHLRQLAARDES